MRKRHLTESAISSCSLPLPATLAGCFARRDHYPPAHINITPHGTSLHVRAAPPPLGDAPKWCIVGVIYLLSLKNLCGVRS